MSATDLAVLFELLKSLEHFASSYHTYQTCETMIEAVTIPYPDDFGDIDAKDAQQLSLKELGTRQTLPSSRPVSAPWTGQVCGKCYGKGELHLRNTAEPLDFHDIALLRSITCDSPFSLAKVVCILRGRARRPKARDFFFTVESIFFGSNCTNETMEIAEVSEAFIINPKRCSSTSSLAPGGGNRACCCDFFSPLALGKFRRIQKPAIILEISNLVLDLLGLELHSIPCKILGGMDIMDFLKHLC